MFSVIFKFELRHWGKNASTHAYFFIFFLLAFGSMAGAAGAFGEGSNSSSSIANSPLSLFNFSLFFNKMLLLILPAIVGAGIFRDFHSNFHSILFTYPFSKKDYLLGKFLSAFFVVAAVAAGVQLGLLLATFLPTADPALLGPFDWRPYFFNYFWFVLPNLFLFSALVFGLVIATRNLYTTFIGLVFCWLAREVIVRLAAGSFLETLGEPLGENALHTLTKNWTIAEQNTLGLPLDSIVWLNRSLWLAVALSVFGLIFQFFKFSQTPVFFNFKTRSRPLKPRRQHTGELPKTPFDFSFFNRLKITWQLAQADFRFILKNGAFVSLVLAGGAFVLVLLTQINPQTDTKILPTTWSILGFPLFFFSFLIQILTFLFAGVLVQRAKTARFFDLVAATPVPNWALLLSKFLALVGMQITLLLSVAAVGVAVQAQRGFHDFQFEHYFFDLFCVHLLGFMGWTCAALFIQTLFENIYLGLFLLILVSFGMSNLTVLGIGSPVFQFGKSPADDFFLKFSDLAGHAHGLRAFLFYKIYWTIGGAVLLGGTLLFWQRERYDSLRERLAAARRRFRGAAAFAILGLAAAFFATGFWLFRLENLPENKVFSSREEQNLIQNFQKKYSHLRHLPQPRIVSVFVKMDIFPAENAFRATGKYVLVNKTGQPQDTLLVKFGFDERTRLDDRQFEKLAADSVLQFAVYKMSKPLAPGDSMLLNFEIESRANTLHCQFSSVLKNGTFLKSDIFPRLGYFAVTDPGQPDDPAAMANHYQSNDSDLIDFETVVSTSAEQTALAPGDLQRTWTAGGRCFFHYKMPRPFKFVFGYLSGVFEVAEEEYRGVWLRVFHHPQHRHNLRHMFDGLRAALDFNDSIFGRCPLRQLQIVEFARSEGSFATLAGDCIPTSELRFVNDAAAAGAIDLAFYVVAHELCHVWWGNEVLPAAVLGASMLTESVAEYLTAKIFEKKYGKRQALRFLEIQSDRYLAGRAGELGQELPLMRVRPEQSYISYGKGAVALYILSEKIGEERLHRALKTFFEQTKNRQQPYPTAPQMVACLKKETPDSLQFLVKDLFEEVATEQFLAYFSEIQQQNFSEK